MSLTAFWTIVLIHLAAAISPGPSFVVSARSSATFGFRYGVDLAFGFGLGALIWAIVALAGISLIFELVPELYRLIKLAGAAFLIYLAFRIWRSAASEPTTTDEAQGAQKGSAAFRLGLWTFISNPKPAVFFGAVFAGLVPVDTPVPWLVAIIVAVFINETGWYIVVARAFSLPHTRRVYLRMKTKLDRAFGVLLALLGVRIALT
ncbi:MAG: LysE family translocator [Marivivens sp.]|nr:LysE family translocator [Marivivens sp.]